MTDPAFRVERYEEALSSGSRSVIEVYLTGYHFQQRVTLTAGNAILLGKKLQREGEAIIAERKGKK